MSADCGNDRTGHSDRQRGTLVKVTMLATTCDKKDCPTIYKTDRGTILVQGETPTDHGLSIPAHETLVEIPVELIREAFGDTLSA